jgi:hypothetical protein
MIRIKENAKPQVWYEEAENGYQVCVRKPHNDYFRTEYIKCQSKEEAKELVTKIKENGYTNISKKDLKECTSDCTKAKNKNFSFGDDDYINIPVKKEEPETKEAPEEKPRAKFEFDDEDDLEHKYNKIPRYDEIPEQQIQETGTNKPIKFGNVQIGKGIL